MIGLLMAVGIALSPAPNDDVVFVGGTGLGAGVDIPSIGGSPSGVTSPFVSDPAEVIVPDYGNAPWDNPQSAVPGIAPVVAGTAGPTTVVGLSKGAQVAHGLEAQDTRTDTSYVMIGDPDGPNGVSHIFGLSPTPVPFTHDVTIVNAEYDGIGDFPDRPLNLLADANALAGFVYIHPNYGVGGASDPLTRLNEATITTTPNPNGTSTTHELIPTHALPLTQPLRDLGLNTTGLDAALRPAIDAGYSRNDKVVAKPAPHKSVAHKKEAAKRRSQ